MSKFISSSIWNFIANFFIRVIGITTFPFLVRFYLREDIAVFKSFQAYVLMLMAIIPIGTNILYLSVPQDDREQRWNLFFFTSLFVSALFALTLFLFSEIPAFFVEDGNNIRINFFMTLVPLVEGCKIILITKLSSIMDFKSISIALIIKQLFLYTSIIFFAYINPVLIILIITVIISEVIELLLLFSKCHNQKIKLTPDFYNYTVINNYGKRWNLLALFKKSLRLDKIAVKYITFSGLEQIFIAFATQFPTIMVVIVLGKSLAPEFQLPFTAVTIPVSLVMRSIARVSFPHFSNLREDEKIISSLFSILFPITFILFPIMVAIHFFAAEISFLFLDSNWSNAVFALQVFPILMLVYMLNMPSSYISSIKGKPYINLIYGIFLFSARILGIYFGYKFGGFTGTVLLFSLGDFIVRFIRLQVDIKLLSLSMKKFYYCIKYNLVSMLVLVSLMWVGHITLSRMVSGISDYQSKIISYLIAFIVAMSLNYTWEKERLHNVLARIISELKSRT